MIERRDAIIGIGVAVGAAVLVLFLKKGSSSGAATSGGTGSQDIAGGFATAGTVYVPTTEYNVNYDTYKNSKISYATTTNNNQSETTTTYAPVNSPGSPIIAPIVHTPGGGAPSPVSITINGGGVTNIPTSQTGKTGHSPAPSGTPSNHPAPAWAGALHGGMHYATPKGGWDPNSVVDNLKSHGYASSIQDRARVAAAMQLPGYTGTAAQNKILLNQLNQHGY